VHARQLLHDAEAQAEAAARTRDVLFALLEEIENAFQVLRQDARTIVPNAERGMAAVQAGADEDGRRTA